MDSILDGILSLQFVFFCLAIGAVTFVIRKIVEYAMVNWWPLKNWNSANKDASFWKEVLLPILPIFLGVLAAVKISQYPYPEGFSSNSSRFIFGLVAGFTSNFAVRLLKSEVSSKVGDYANKIFSALKSANSSTDTSSAKPESQPEDNK